MKTFSVKLTSTLLLTAVVGLVGCSVATPTIQKGPDAEVSFDGLHVVDHSRADIAWARPDIDLSPYSKIMLTGAGIEYTATKNRGSTSMERSRGGPFFIDDETRDSFEALVKETFREEMSKIEYYELVNKPGPDVLHISAALLDVESYVPDDSMVTAGRGSIFIRSVGEATLVLELRDSVSGAILARSVDRRAAEAGGDLMIESNRVTNTAEVRRLIRAWARSLRQSLDGFAAPKTQT